MAGDVVHELPQPYIDRGWRIEREKFGWAKGVNDERGLETISHYLAPHRGLKFVLRDIDRLERTHAGG